MTNQEKAQILRVRLKTLKTRPTATDSPGVIKKVERQIRNLEKN